MSSPLQYADIYGIYTVPIDENAVKILMIHRVQTYKEETVISIETTIIIILAKCRCNFALSINK